MTSWCYGGDLRKSSKSYLASLNSNAYNIKLTADWNSDTIQFLDLELYKRHNQVHTHTYFKDVDRNGYVFTRSCYHPRWIGAIPKGQLKETVMIKMTISPNQRNS